LDFRVQAVLSKPMKINIWYSEHAGQWRWTLTDESKEPMHMEAGDAPTVRKAMSDVAATVEYLIERDSSILEPTVHQPFS